ncbi:MAG: hypothetical protein ACI8PT_002880 [Gammaproteobacteria bacterium]|jgi:hypothetical protein
MRPAIIETNAVPLRSGASMAPERRDARLARKFW